MSVLAQHQMGGWLLQNHSALESWLNNRFEYCHSEPEPFLPVIRDFQKLIEGDAEIYMGFHQMFEQVPTEPPYNEDPTGKPQVRDAQLISAFDDSSPLNLRFATTNAC